MNNCNMNNHVRAFIDEKLMQYGFIPNLRGFYYLSESIYCFILDKNTIRDLKNCIYPVVASRYGVSSSTIDKAIKNVLCSCWRRKTPFF